MRHANPSPTPTKPPAQSTKPLTNPMAVLSGIIMCVAVMWTGGSSRSRGMEPGKRLSKVEEMWLPTSLLRCNSFWRLLASVIFSGALPRENTMTRCARRRVSRPSSNKAKPQSKESNPWYGRQFPAYLDSRRLSEKAAPARILGKHQKPVILRYTALPVLPSVPNLPLVPRSSGLCRFGLSTDGVCRPSYRKHLQHNKQHA